MSVIGCALRSANNPVWMSEKFPLSLSPSLYFSHPYQSLIFSQDFFLLILTNKILCLSSPNVPNKCLLCNTEKNISQSKWWKSGYYS